MKVEGIILAGGLSTRLGTNKLLLNIDGSTVIERCICGMRDLCSRIIVVGGHSSKDINHILNKYPKVELIDNPNYLDGMFSSIKKGFSNVVEERVFLIPGDYPVVDRQTYIDMLKVDEDIVIPTYNRRKGHPLLMKSYLIGELLKDTTCKTLRDFTTKKGFASINVADPGILMDIDTIEDYKKVLMYFQARN